MDQSQHTAQGETNSTSRNEVTSSTPTASGTVLFREIHKNAWLKRLPLLEKRTAGAFPKKGERVWVVFCVHDDAEAFLEVYLDQKVAVMHKPEWSVSLINCLHVSPTICAQEEEYEFVVTLSTEVVRFTAPSWELMMEWVDTIRSKLRELKVLSPRENIYSRMPEPRLPLAPTRDPNSPLPPPPAGPSVSVPGVEPLQSESSSPSDDSSSANSSSDENISPTLQHTSNDSVSLQVRTSSTSLYITQSEPPIYTRAHQALNRTTSVPESSVFVNRDENVTVIEVPHSAAPLDYEGVFNFNFIEDALPNENQDFRENGENTEAYYTPPQTPPRSRTSEQVEFPESGSSYYECVFLPNLAHSPRSLDSTSGGNNPSRTRSLNSSSSGNDSSRTRSLDSNMSVNDAARTRPVESSTNGNDTPRTSSEVTAAETEPCAVPRRRRSSSNSEATPSPSGSSHAPRSRAATARPEAERRLQPAPHPYRQIQQATPVVEVVGTGRLTLREQQVLQLRREMLHPGGVRLTVRRKDCTGSIALVDAFGAVWIAGWKQKECPMLYNALHIGDQLLSVAGILVQSATDAQKIIRGAHCLYVELIIRRLPFGRVFAIRREAEGQSLGIVQEGNTAEIREVVLGGLAARHGLSPRAQTCDGLSLTNWFITEINGRPLNLFFKDGEVRDRLNAVGKEISILVQPLDLVKQLKKQLKAIRGYKDYIVQ